MQTKLNIKKIALRHSQIFILGMPRSGTTLIEQIISPHKNKRSINTASQLQVRQKVYKRSSEAWLKYKLFLNGVFDNLESL